MWNENNTQYKVKGSVDKISFMGIWADCRFPKMRRNRGRSICHGDDVFPERGICCWVKCSAVMPLCGNSLCLCAVPKNSYTYYSYTSSTFSMMLPRPCFTTGIGCSGWGAVLGFRHGKRFCFKLKLGSFDKTTSWKVVVPLTWLLKLCRFQSGDFLVTVKERPYVWS